MKHLLLSVATTTTLLLILFSTIANADNDKIVYDAMGDSVKTGQNYYIVPYNIAPVGGGFTWKKYDSLSRLRKRCSKYYLIQYNSTTDFGEPTVFYPLHPMQSKITFSTNLNIAFNVSVPKDPCHATTNLWKVEDDKVELGGLLGVRDPSYVFTIEDLKEGGYNIRFCPCNRRNACGGLGIIVTQNGERQLVVNATSPLAVAFEPGPIFHKKHGNFA